MQGIVPDARIVPVTGLKPHLVMCTCQDVGTGVGTGSGGERDAGKRKGGSERQVGG